MDKGPPGVPNCCGIPEKRMIEVGNPLTSVYAEFQGSKPNISVSVKGIEK